MGPVRVKPSSEAILGGAVGNGTLTTTGRTQVVWAVVPAETPWATAGTAVTVTDSSDRTIKGKVVDVETIDGAGGSGGGGTGDGAEVTLTVTLSAPPKKPDAAGAVTVRHVNASRKDVLCVPVTALVALAGGGFGVQPGASPSGLPGSGTGFLAVTAGMFADGKVEVSGPGLAEGLRVPVPKGE